MNFGLPNLCPSCRRDISLLVTDGTSSCPFCGAPVWHAKIGGRSWYYSRKFADELFQPKQALPPDFDERVSAEHLSQRARASGLPVSEPTKERASEFAMRLIEEGALTYWQCWHLLDSPAPRFIVDGYTFLDQFRDEPTKVYLCAEKGDTVVLKFSDREQGLYNELRAGRSGPIVRCRETKMVDGRLCLVREYVKGPSLMEVSLPIELDVHVICEAARALHALHAEGIVHRCIWPHKILLRYDGSVKLLGSGRCESATGARGETGARMDVHNLMRILGCLLGHYRKSDFVPSYTRLSACFNVGLTRFGTESSLIDTCENLVADFHNLSAIDVANTLSGWIADYEPL